MAKRKILRHRVSDEATGAKVDFVVTVATKLSVELIDRFCGLVERGLPVDGVCDYLGVATRTFWEWQKRGQRYLDGDCEPAKDAIFGLFVQRVKRALAVYRLDRIDRLHRSSQWVREITILERRDRKSFSRNDPPGGAIEEFDADERFL